MQEKKVESKNTPRKLLWLTVAVIAGLGSLGLAFNALFISYQLFSISRSSFLFPGLIICLLFLLIFYAVYYGSKQKYLATTHRQAKNTHTGIRIVFLLKTHATLLVVLVVVVLAILGHLLGPSFDKRPLSTDEPTTNAQMAWQKFIKDNSLTTYYEATPVFEAHYSQGCFKDSEIPSGGSCIFTNVEFYVLAGEYSENVKQILTYLLSHGYEFQKNEGTARGIDYYSDPDYLSDELENSLVLIPMKAVSSSNSVTLAVGPKTLINGGVFFKAPQSTIDSIPDKAMIYTISESKKLD